MACTEACDILQMSEPEPMWFCGALSTFRHESKCPHSVMYAKRNIEFMKEYKKQMEDQKVENELKLTSDVFTQFQTVTDTLQLCCLLVETKDQSGSMVDLPIEKWIMKIYQSIVLLET
jgi:hypothetical protein